MRSPVSPLLLLLNVATADTDLVLHGCELDEVSTDYSEHQGKEKVGPIRVCSNSGCGQRRCCDPCDGCTGQKFTQEARGDVNGFIMVNDCQIVFCDKCVGSDAQLVGSSSHISSVSGGSTAICNVVKSSGAGTRRCPILESGKCSCKTGVINGGSCCNLRGTMNVHWMTLAKT